MLRCSLTHAISLPSAQCSHSPVLLYSGVRLTPSCRCAIHQLSMVWQLHWHLLMINITSKRVTVGALRRGFHFCPAWPWQSHRLSEPPQLPESGCLCAGVAVLGL